MAARGWLIAALLLLAGCNASGLVYNNADWLIWRWANGLLDADDTQEPVWRSTIEQAVERHRASLLPQVVVLLQTVEHETRRGLSQTAVSCLFERYEGLYREHARFLVPLASGILTGLRGGQIDHLAEQLHERNAEYRDDYLDSDPAEQRRLQVDRYAQRIEGWTGDLTTAQLRLVEQMMLSMPDLADDWLAYREHQQARLIAMLRAGAGVDAVRAFLTAWWVEREDRSAVLREKRRAWQRGAAALAETLHAALDEQQRDHLQRRIADLRADLAELVDPAVALLAQTPPAACGSLAMAADSADPGR